MKLLPRSAWAGWGRCIAPRDGQRFIMVKDESSAGRLNVVLNWFSDLNRLAPVAAR